MGGGCRAQASLRTGCPQAKREGRHTLAAWSSQWRFGSTKDACAGTREAGARARHLSVPYACQQSAELYLTVGAVLKKARLMASSPSSTLGLDKEFTPLS